MRIALVTPCLLGADANPGWYMITAGIRALTRHAMGGCDFIPIDMIDDRAAHWAAAATCDAAILCGNPRFTLSDPAFWECGIWDRLLQLQAGGVRVIDGWAGSAYSIGTGKTIDEMAEEIGSLPRNVEYLKTAAAMHGRITRDPLMQRIYERAGIPSTLLPCSSYWVPSQVPTPIERRGRDAIVVVALHGQPQVGHALRAIRKDMSGARPVDVIASTLNDYRWCLAEGMRDAILLPDPESLLERYGRYRNVLALRIHAAIPAASVGCAVHAVAIDTRALTCEQFGIETTAVHALGVTWPEFSTVDPIDPDFSIQTLRGMLC